MRLPDQEGAEKTGISKRHFDATISCDGAFDSSRPANNCNPPEGQRQLGREERSSIR
jgi:hypothetical protein